jgi:hypothetical protein
MISSGKDIVGNNVGVNDGSGVNVKVAEGRGVFDGTTVLVAITVGVTTGMTAEHPTSVPALKKFRKDKKSWYVSFDVISFHFFVII